MHEQDDPNTLINNKVRSVFEDTRGNLWIGTMGDGLHTFDRKTGKIIRHPRDKAKSGELVRPEVNSSVDHITFIREDATGHIWIGTLSNGLLRYDPETGQSEHYSAQSNTSSGFNDNSGWWAYASSDGLFWVSTQEGNLFQVDLYTNYFPHFVLDSLVVIDMIEDTPGSVWFGTSGGLIHKDLKTGILNRFQHDPDNSGSLSDNIVSSLVKDNKGNFWLGTQNGLNRFDPESEVFTKYFNNPDDYESLSSNDISALLIDRDQNVWIGTWGMGLNRLDQGTGKFQRYVHNDDDTTSISDNGVLALWQDESGDIWSGNANWSNSLTYGGINRLDVKTGIFQHYLPGKHVNYIFRDSHRIIWAGTDSGLYYFEEASDSFRSVKESNVNIDVVNIQSITEDLNQNLWIMAEDGIYRINDDRDKLIRFGKENDITIERLIYKVLLLQNGDLLFGSMFGYYRINNDNLNIPVAVPQIYYKDFWLNGKPIKPGNTNILANPFNETSELELAHDQNVFSIDLSVINYSLPGSVTNFYKLENYETDWQPLINSNQVHYFNVPHGKYDFRFKTINKNNGISVERDTEIHIAKPWWVTWWAYFLYGLTLVGGIFGIDRFQRKRLLEKERSLAKEKELQQAREIEKAYKELKATQSQLIQSEKMASLGELTAGIAHEIQNPLNFVNNFSEVNKELLEELLGELKNGSTDEIRSIATDLIQNEEKISHHGRRAESIVKNMLQHSRGDSGQMEMTDINAMVEEYVNLAFHGMRARDKFFNADYKIELDKRISSIKVVPQDIGRVLLNLINNAFYAVAQSSKLKAQSNYRPEVIVNTKKLDGNVEIRVKDNGDGIPDSIRDKIFQPFFTTKPTGQGTGLGLSLSYDIIKAHNGEVEFESDSNSGTTFKIILPSH
jgi:signal transduction histidine kinase/ligand-binding sensor domain-containing protein